ncbi:hypothetical protein BV501_11795 [Erwinia sp. OAMSP11]|nr:hypothetical protein BV501_11795 [Erwinia sp. OAMSP11]
MYAFTLQDLILQIVLPYQSCECPHRLSDKLLKSAATGITPAVARWRILRHPSEESRIFSFFFSGK